MNGESNDPLDTAIDRVARQIVEHDPPQRMYAAVLSRLRGADSSRRPRMRLSFVAASALAVCVAVLVLWNQSREVVQQLEPSRPPIVAGPRSAAPPDDPQRPADPPQIAPRIVESRPRRAELPEALEADVSELAAAIPDVEVPDIPMSAVGITTIAMKPLGMDPIQISDIALEPY